MWNHTPLWDVIFEARPTRFVHFTNGRKGTQRPGCHWLRCGVCVCVRASLCVRAFVWSCRYLCMYVRMGVSNCLRPSRHRAQDTRISSVSGLFGSFVGHGGGMAEGSWISVSTFQFHPPTLTELMRVCAPPSRKKPPKTPTVHAYIHASPPFAADTE